MLHESFAWAARSVGSKLILLPLAVLIGCSNRGAADFSLGSWWPWSAAGERAAKTGVDSAAQASRAASANPDASSARNADSPDPRRVANQERQAAAETVIELRKARAAAAAATKASEEATAASEKATQAAARAMLVSPAPISPASSTVTGPETNSTMILSSMNDRVTEENRARTTELMRKLAKSVGQIDRRKLGPDDAKRRDLGVGLLQSAQKALAQNDYVAANSLATKASVMLAPLGAGAPPVTSDR